MRQVIFQSCELYSCLGQIAKDLRDRSQQDKNDFNFVSLADILSKEDKEWAQSIEMGDYVGINKIGMPPPYAIIWAPHPSERDWFANLTAEGYTGKKILIHTGMGRWSNQWGEKPGFRIHADYSFSIPCKNLANKVYKALRK